MAWPARTFLVTGAAGGIGGALVDVLVQRGQAVTATDVDMDALASRRAQAGWSVDLAQSDALDVRNPEAWQRAVHHHRERFGPLDVLLNVAGTITGKPGVDTPPADVHRQVDVNLKGVVFGTQAAARAMTARGGGHVINFGSFSGLMPAPGVAIYSATKYAVRGFSLAMAEELRASGVAVTLVCTGTVETEMNLAQRRYIAEQGLRLPRDILRPYTVARAVLAPRVLQARPLELYVPALKGMAARVADLAPGAALAAMKLLGG